MKIQNPAASATLLARMRAAHAEEVAETSTPTAQSASAARARAPPPAGEAAAAASTSPVERAIVAVAKDVIQGRIDSPDHARGAVVDAIVTHSYGHVLDGDQATVDMVKLSLVDDPQFQREVDDMLIHAARDLARSR